MQGLLRNHNKTLLLLEVGAATGVHISTGRSTQLTQGFFLSCIGKEQKSETNTSNLSSMFKITISKSLTTFSHHPGPHTGLTQDQQSDVLYPNTFCMSMHMPHISVFNTTLLSVLLAMLKTSFYREDENVMHPLPWVWCKEVGLCLSIIPHPYKKLLSSIAHNLFQIWKEWCYWSAEYT